MPLLEMGTVDDDMGVDDSPNPVGAAVSIAVLAPPVDQLCAFTADEFTTWPFAVGAMEVANAVPSAIA